MTRLVVTLDAEADINGILDYLAREAGERVAENYGNKFRQTIERLMEFPRLGTGAAITATSFGRAAV